MRRNNYNLGKKYHVVIVSLLEVLAVRSTITKIDLTKGSTINLLYLIYAALFGEISLLV